MTQFSFGKQTRFFAAAVLTAVLGLLACSAGRADDWLAGNNNDYPVNTIESVRAAIEDMIDRSVSQTLTRSLFTSVTTFLMVLCLFIFGVTDIRYFALPLMVGVVCGTYSSICLASPLWYEMKKQK